jgi:hypothetical protein
MIPRVYDGAYFAQSYTAIPAVYLTYNRRSTTKCDERAFDRMLTVQALTEPLVLLTNDGLLARYPAPV